MKSICAPYHWFLSIKMLNRYTTSRTSTKYHEIQLRLPNSKFIMIPIFEFLILNSHCTKRIVPKNIWKLNLETWTLHEYNTRNKQWKLHRHTTIKKMFSFKINKLSTTDNILNGIPYDVLYTGYLNKDISFGDIVYFEPKNVQYKKLPNGTIDQLKVSLIDGDGNEIFSNFKISIVLNII